MFLGRKRMGSPARVLPDLLRGETLRLVAQSWLEAFGTVELSHPGNRFITSRLPKSQSAGQGVSPGGMTVLMPRRAHTRHPKSSDSTCGHVTLWACSRAKEMPRDFFRVMEATLSLRGPQRAQALFLQGSAEPHRVLEPIPREARARREPRPLSCLSR